MNRLLPLLLAFTLLCGAIETSSAPAAEHESESLFRLVGADVGLVIVVTDLKEQRNRFFDSPLWGRVVESPLFESCRASNEFRKLQDLRQVIENASGQRLETVIDTLFGRTVLLAVYPYPGDKPVGVLLTRTASPEALKAGLQLWDRLDPTPTEAREYRGIPYFVRSKAAAANRPAYSVSYVTIGEVLAVSENASAIERVIDLSLVPAADEKASKPSPRDASLLQRADFVQLREKLAAGCIVWAYLSPRPWDQILGVESPASDAAARLFADAWRQCSAIAAGVRLQEGIVGELLVRYETTSPSPVWEAFLAAVPASQETPANFPANSLVAYSGRNYGGLLTHLLVERLAAGESREFEQARPVLRGLFLGLDLFEDVLPRLNRVTAYVIPRPQAVRGTLPVAAVAAVTMDSTAEDPQSALLSDALDNALGTGLNLLVAGFNRQHPQTPAIVRRERTEEQRLRWAESIYDWQPAYALSASRLLLATSPEMIRQVALSSTETPLADNSKLSQWAGRFTNDSEDVLLVSFVEIRRLLRERRAGVSKGSATGDEKHSAEIERKLDRSDALLRLADALLLTARLDSGELRFSAALLADESLSSGPAR